MQSNSKHRFVFIASLILLATVTRLMPHPPNVSPMSAVALFGGAVFLRKRWAFLVCFAALLLSDIALYSLVYQEWIGGMMLTIIPVYLSFALIVLMGSWLKERRKIVPILGTTIASSLLFFLVTNFGSWAFFEMYPKTLSGLLTCYTAGIPFYQNTFLGDLFFSGALFGCFALAENSLPVVAHDSASGAAD